MTAEFDDCPVPEPYRSAHKKSCNHREEVLNCKFVGCFYCLLMYSPNSIKEWIDDDQTALCPVCGIDAVLPIGGESEIEETFLGEMSRWWFKNGVEAQMDERRATNAEVAGSSPASPTI